MATAASQITGSLLTEINSLETSIDNLFTTEYVGGAIFETVLTGTSITDPVIQGELRRRYMTYGAQRYRWTDVLINPVSGSTNFRFRDRNFPVSRT